MAIPTHTLNDGTTLPAIGFGTYPLRGADGVAAVRGAIEAGYRLLDTAVNYENETEVGEAIRQSGIAREEIQVASKIPGRHHGYDDAIASVHGSLDRLGLDYIDLHLIHWPNPSVGKYVEAWRALIDLQKQGLVRSIGVSNFTAEHLERIIDDTGVTPSVNQIELHPYFPQSVMRDANERYGIRTESWSPLGKRQAPFAEPAVATAAEKYGVTPGQVILRWQTQLGAIPIPKSATPEHALPVEGPPEVPVRRVEDAHTATLEGGADSVWRTRRWPAVTSYGWRKGPHRPDDVPRPLRRTEHTAPAS